MPGMDGFALAKKVRETDPGIKVIFTTGYTDTGLLEEQPKEAAYELIPKPFSITDLSSVVRKVLGKEAAAVED
jgi:two-component system cell cycle sensor histidine kinase/response regulator CckA